jgi:ABC-type dipeptide/oligopeptide/nickel transport system permease component
MIRYALSKILWGFFVIFGTATVAFVVLRIVPGNPLTLILQGTPTTPQLVHSIDSQFHLNDPIIVQYFLYLEALAHGNLGVSIANGQSVSTQIFSVLPTTMQLVGTATVFGVVVGFLLGLAASWTRFRWLDRVLSAGNVVLASIPAFWAGLILLTFFSFSLRWFPAAGNTGLKSIVLPTISLSLPVIAIVAQLIRDSMKEVMLEPYVLAARSKGLS